MVWIRPSPVGCSLGIGSALKLSVLVDEDNRILLTDFWPIYSDVIQKCIEGFFQLQDK